MAIATTQARWESVPPHVRDALIEFRDGLRQRFGDELLDVRLYGSYARGEQHSESDVDVFVLFPEVDTACADEVVGIAVDVQLKYGLLISARPWDLARWRMYCEQDRRYARDVKQEGIPL